MGIDLYGINRGASTRAIMMTAKVLGLDLNVIQIETQKQEQLTPEFLKMNPQHTIPTLDDNGFYLWESRAIVTYLADAYAKDDSFYPKDPKKRGLINQRLYFDGFIMYKRFWDLWYPKQYLKTPVPDLIDKMEKLDEAFQFLSTFLSGNSEFVAGDHLTVADVCLVSTVTTIEAYDSDLSKYPRVVRWLEKCISMIPGYAETNGKGLEEFRKFVAETLKE